MSGLTWVRTVCLLGSCIIIGRVLGAVNDPVDACQVFSHPEDYDGKTFRVRGVFVAYAEVELLIAYPEYEGSGVAAEISGGTNETVTAVRKNGGLGVWLFSILTGRFDKNSNGGYQFRLDSIEVLRRVKPDDRFKKRRRS